MSRDEPLRAMRRLRNGRDPLSDEILPPDHLCQRADVVRALFAAVAAMEREAGGAAAAPTNGTAGMNGVAVDDCDAAPEAALRPRRPRPPKTGQPWSEDEDRRLADAFDGGADERELAAAFGRSRTSIRARLIRLGRGALLEDGPAPRYPVAGPVAGPGAGPGANAAADAGASAAPG